MAYTLQDFIKLNPDYQKRYDPKTKTAFVSNAKTGKEISFLEGQGQQYGLGSTIGGSHSISDPGKLISALSTPEPARYESPYVGKIGETLAAIQSRPVFNYDPASDTGLQAAQGNAMDAVSRAAARRNMLYSDSNKSQMGKSALALVPQFRQQALGEYQQQGQDLYNQLQPLLQLENQNYGQFRDTVGDTRYADQTAYSRGRDATGDARYYDETAYNRGQNILTNQFQEAGLTGTYKGKPTMQKISADAQAANAKADNSFAREKFTYDQGMDVFKYGTEQSAKQSEKINKIVQDAYGLFDKAQVRIPNPDLDKADINPYVMTNMLPEMKSQMKDVFNRTFEKLLANGITELTPEMQKSIFQALPKGGGWDVINALNGSLKSAPKM